MAVAWLAPPFGTRPTGENTLFFGLSHSAIGGVGLGLTVWAHNLPILKHFSLTPALLRGPGGHPAVGFSVEFRE